MSRLTPPTPADVTADAQGVLDKVDAQFGFVPNMFKTLASNPAVLDVVTTLQAKSSRLLDARTRHTIALAVSQLNGCDYCLAIHAYGSAKAGGMSIEDINMAREGRSPDPKRAAAARFAQQVVESRGRVPDSELVAVRDAGYSDPQILAIVTLAVQYLLTNFINNVNQTDVDIPAVGATTTPA